MRIILINSWYGKFSTGMLVQKFHEYLMNCGHEVYVYFGHGEKVENEKVVKVSNDFELYKHALLCRITGYEGIFSTHQTKKLIDNIEAFSPDLIYLFNLHAYYLNEYLLLEYLKRKNLNVIYMLFDEYAYLGKCCFSENCMKFQSKCQMCSKVKSYPASWFFDRSKILFEKKRKLFYRWDKMTLVGVEFIKKRAAISAIAKNNKFISIDMGVELEKIFYPRDASGLREKLNVKGSDKIVLTVGKYSDARKGVRKFIEVARLCADKQITFINVGYDGKEKDLPHNFIGIPYICEQEKLAEYYSLSDVYVSMSYGEAMSLACMEALGCGTKLIGFDISGMSCMIDKEYATFIKYNDISAFADAICHITKKTKISIDMCRKYALSKYNILDFNRKLEHIGLDKI